MLWILANVFVSLSLIELGSQKKGGYWVGEWLNVTDKIHN